MSIDNVKDDTVYAYATDVQFDYIKTLGYDYIILPAPGSLYRPTGGISTTNWDTYPSFDEYVDSMYNYQTEYPGLCQVVNIGYSVQGREILFVKLSANVGIEENEPEVMYSSTMHGDETTGYILMLRLIEYLLDNYGTDPQATNMLDNMEIWINPLANPDGTYINGNDEIYNPTRYNANGRDLNRNFPDPQDGPHPDGHDWQPETIAMLNFFDQHSFIISANFHGGAEVVNYPWDTWVQRHADDAWLIQISREYADSAQANSPSGYMTDLYNGITNGYDWYTINGGRQDYLNYWKGCRETTIELSHVKFIPESQLDAHWNYNKGALLCYIEQAYYGIRGLVTDAITGLPVAATISVLSHDIDSSEVYTDPDIGDYYRMIEAGTYSLRFTAPGYMPQTVNNISVTYRNTITVSVQLQPLPPTLEFYGHDAGFVNVGDTVSMAITLTNIGGAIAEGINAVLSTNDSYTTITQPSSSYPNIPGPGGTGVSNSDYVFVVSSDCPDFHQIEFRLDMTASGGYTDSAFFSIRVGLIVEDFESGNFNSFSWEMTGDASWIIVSVEVYEGSYSASSGFISDEQNSIISLDYEVAFPGTLSFYYKVSSESDYDYLKFYINNDLQNEWSGEVGWTQASYSISPGQYNFKWEYDKDHSLSYGSDCAWIDYIDFPLSGAALEITTASLPDWTVDRPYSQQLEASGGTGTLTWGDLYNDLIGTGLTLSSSGLISGAPASAGQISFTARVTDQGSHQDSKPFSFTINPAVQVTTDSLPDWTIDQPYSQQLQSTGGTGAITWSDLYSDLDDTGLSLSTDGLVSGTPLSSGEVNFTARIVDVTGSADDKLLSFTINPALEITTDSLPDGDEHQPYSYQLESSGGTGVKNWSDRDNDLDGTGLSLSPTGLLSGTPGEAGTINFTALVSDAAGDTDEKLLSVVVDSTAAFLPGDANGDGQVIGSDITYLVNYFKGINPPPDPFLAGDANGDCAVIGSDVTYMINYFRGIGPAPLIGDCDGI